MRRYLLDSSLLAGYLNGRPIAVQLITPWTAARQAATSILCYAEVLEYIKGFPNFAVRHTQLKQLLSEVYPYFRAGAVDKSSGAKPWNLRPASLRANPSRL
jgi:hypothetical protein